MGSEVKFSLWSVPGGHLNIWGMGGVRCVCVCVRLCVCVW